MTTLPELFARAWRCYQAGHLLPAIELYEAILRDDPYHADAWHLLGIARSQQGRHQEGLDCIQKALALDGSVPDFHCNLGVVHRALGKRTAARASFEQALRLDPRFPEAHYHLGMMSREQGQQAEALASFQEAVQARPSYPQARQALGQILLDLDRLDEAVVQLRQGPQNAATFFCLGQALHQSGNLVEALSNYERALHLQPNLEGARVGRAVARYQQQLQQGPGDAVLHTNLGNALLAQKQPEEAVAAYQQALRLQPDFHPAYNNLGMALKDLGQPAEAVASFAQALRLQPDYPVAHSNLLLTLNYDPHADPAAVFAEHRRWGERYGRVASAFTAHTNDASPERRLRIGYVSPDFHRHPVAFFVEPLLAHHDPHRYEIYCYAEVPAPDSTTARLQGMVEGWRSTCGQTDRQVAEQIHADGIDILVDLAGHTADNRLRAFAYKPAPIQATGIGYPNTTGLLAIDYKLTDAVMDPPDGPRRNTEQETRLSTGLWCHVPPDGAPEVGPLPALATGRITLGSLHNLGKLSDPTFDLWTQVLQALPSARLLIARDSLTPARQASLRRRLTERGVAAERIELRQTAHPLRYLWLYDEIDISLDVFPWSGGTVTCEALWMGVPIVTRTGPTHASRITASILTTLQLPELIADDPQEYVDVVRDLANDRQRLCGLRQDLRDRMRATLCMAQRVAGIYEEAYRTWWRRWCAGQRAAGSLGP